MLDDVEREVVKAAEAPDRYRQQHADLERWLLGNQQRSGRNPDAEEQDAFEFDQARVGEVFHWVTSKRTMSAKRLSTFETRHR